VRSIHKCEHMLVKPGEGRWEVWWQTGVSEDMTYISEGECIYCPDCGTRFAVRNGQLIVEPMVPKKRLEEAHTLLRVVANHRRRLGPECGGVGRYAPYNGGASCGLCYGEEIAMVCDRLLDDIATLVAVAEEGDDDA